MGITNSINSFFYYFSQRYLQGFTLAIKYETHFMECKWDKSS